MKNTLKNPENNQKLPVKKLVSTERKREHVKGIDGFIVLTEKPYKAFQNGTKNHELRPYCLRWSKKHYPIGRPVTLSWGYSKKFRLYGVVRSYRSIQAKDLPVDYREAVECHYNTLDMKIAMIGIDVQTSDTD